MKIAPFIKCFLIFLFARKISIPRSNCFYSILNRTVLTQDVDKNEISFIGPRRGTTGRYISIAPAPKGPLFPRGLAEKAYITCFPIARYLEIEDSEHVLRAIRMTPTEMTIDLVRHTPGGLVLPSGQIARALKRHRGKKRVKIKIE